MVDHTTITEGLPPPHPRRREGGIGRGGASSWRGT